MLIARNNQTHSLAALKLITVSGGKGVEGESASGGTPAAKMNWLYDLDQAAMQQPQEDHHIEYTIDEWFAMGWR